MGSPATSWYLMRQWEWENSKWTFSTYKTVKYIPKKKCVFFSIFYFIFSLDLRSSTNIIENRRKYINLFFKYETRHGTIFVCYIYHFRNRISRFSFTWKRRTNERTNEWNYTVYDEMHVENLESEHVERRPKQSEQMEKFPLSMNGNERMSHPI